MSEPRCLFTLMRADREHHEELLRDFVTPVAHELRDQPQLDSLFFARYNVPVWELRFRVLGEPSWVDGPVRELVERRLEPVLAAGLAEGVEFATYDREVERYGGLEGMALAEKIFLHDSLACLDLMAAERRGELAKSRREFSLLMTDRTLDLFGFSRERRLAFYSFGYQWALEMKTWEENELQLLDERYQELRDGLLELFRGEPTQDEATLWGGEEPAAIAHRCLAALAPLADEIRAGLKAGRLQQDLNYLVWSYAHMHCNRLGIDPGPEAILRYFMHRLLQDQSVAA